MMWKKILLAVLGAGMLGATASQSYVSADDCPAGCNTCACQPMQKIITTLGFSPLHVSDVNGAATTIAGRRQRITGGTAAQRRTMDYQVATLGSTHHAPSAWLNCSDGLPVNTGQLGANSAGPLSCPSGTTIVSAWVGVQMTTTVCPSGYLICNP